MKNSKLLVKSLAQTFLFGIQSARWVKLKAAIVLLISYDFLFYDVVDGILGGGLNYLFFTIILLGVSAVIHNKSIYDSVYIWSAIAMLLSSINIFYLRTDWSVAIYILSFFSFLGSSLNNNAKNIIISSVQALVLMIVNPFNSFVRTIIALMNIDGKSQISKAIPYVLLPTALVTIFTLLYSATNTMLKSFLVSSSQNMNWIYDIFAFERIILWVLFFILFGALFVTPFKETILSFGGYSKKLVREEMFRHSPTFSFMGLNKELKIASISLASLNMLLLGIILFDVFVMFSSTYNYSAHELSELVHSGTKIVTFTIALSAGLVILFFRRNLNFHPKNKWLLQLANTWLVLNSIYVFLVGLKNAKYIFDYGLTAKRLSVVIFLASCLALLAFSHLKIKNKWTIKYFFNRVLGAVCVIVLAYSVVDHKAAIVGFAAHIQTENIDTEYLTQTCIHRQKLLYNHKKAIELKTGKELQFYGWERRDTKTNSWKSFNYMDHAEQEFRNSDTYQDLHFNERTRGRW